ncbi:hypothetical protein KLP40_15170 [Hymenobacter sp. NST-14]|uniref:hypothetical protein n=1 Tax=Hymenobacter piscis TaxID=2839984 RepID=UPI001C013ADE|nr:hypothetical protein [Hymenobacter piscis]MBT9394510.1 hypothetical protein [Hymenobacter piscis]
MNEAHLHLLLNHTPILGCLFGLLVLGAGLVKASPPVIRTGLITVLGAALLCLPTQLTGKGAEEVVEKLPGISHQLIEAHEEAAELGFWALELTGALALLALLQTGRQRLFIRLALAGALLSFGLLARTGHLGGQIRHPEIGK